MPRCATSARRTALPSASASGSQRYLPRRWAAVKRAPGQRRDEVVGALEVPADGARVVHLDGRRPCGRRPTAPGRGGRPRPRAVRARLSPRGRRPTGPARRSRRPPARRPSWCGRCRGRGPVPASSDGGGERLRVVGAVVLDDVARARRGRAAAPSSWRLVFQSRPAPRVAASTSSGSNSRCTIAAGGVQPAAEVDRADQRLERVGEDRVLVPAAGGLLAAAEQQVRADAAVAEPARDAGQRASC